MNTILKSNLFFITCLICQIYYSWLDFRWLITAKAGQGGRFTEPMLEPMLTGVTSQSSVWDGDPVPPGHSPLKEGPTT